MTYANQNIHTEKVVYTDIIIIQQCRLWTSCFMAEINLHREKIIHSLKKRQFIDI